MGGECKRCGRCCVEAWRFAYTAEVDDKTGEILPSSIKAEPRIEPEDTEYFVNKKRCAQLSYDDKGKAVCNIQENKPLVCKLYPTVPGDLIFETCGYAVDQ